MKSVRFGDGLSAERLADSQRIPGGIPNGFRAGFPTDSRRIPGGFPADSQRIPNGFPTDSGRIPGGFPADSGRIPSGFRVDSGRIPGGFQADSQRIPGGFQADSQRIPGGFQGWPTRGGGSSRVVNRDYRMGVVDTTRKRPLGAALLADQYRRGIAWGR